MTFLQPGDKSGTRRRCVTVVYSAFFLLGALLSFLSASDGIASDDRRLSPPAYQSAELEAKRFWSTFQTWLDEHDFQLEQLTPDLKPLHKKIKFQARKSRWVSRLDKISHQLRVSKPGEPSWIKKHFALNERQKRIAYSLQYFRFREFGTLPELPFFNRTGTALTLHSRPRLFNESAKQSSF